MSYSSYPGGPNQSSYPGGPQSSYPGGFPQSSYPGGDYNQAQPSYHDQNYQSPAPYNQSHSPAPYGSQSPAPYGQAHSPAPYGQQSPAPYGGPGGQPAPPQYDEHGNLIPEGERGLGAMALGAAGGWAGNKMTGGHLGTFSSLAGGAIAGQLLSKLGDKNKHGHGGQQHNPYAQQGYGQQPYGQNGNQGPLGGLGSFFGKK